MWTKWEPRRSPLPSTISCPSSFSPTSFFSCLFHSSHSLNRPFPLPYYEIWCCCFSFFFFNLPFPTFLQFLLMFWSSVDIFYIRLFSDTERTWSWHHLPRSWPACVASATTTSTWPVFPSIGNWPPRLFISLQTSAQNCKTLHLTSSRRSSQSTGVSTPQPNKNLAPGGETLFSIFYFKDGK